MFICLGETEINSAKDVSERPHLSFLGFNDLG